MTALIRRTADEWCALKGVYVHDPDGWRRDGCPWDRPLTEAEFDERAAMSTCGPTTRLRRIEWVHPRLGRISETACPSHVDEVLAALRALGIGCSGNTERDRSVCDRCRHRGVRVRRWLQERVDA